MTENVVDIKTRKVVDRADIDESLPMAKYFDVWKKRSKESNIQSVLIITVNKDNGIQWDVKDEDFLQLMQLYIELDAMKEILYALLYPGESDLEIVDE